eukprot:TRINITY_DN7934_c0_g1_i2.p1 TRINITY_DN7934_c0_g1~~TRINITY_DN7934_c0_g1_i2.p1  ORF type:complete len:634 (-),score=111.85 TRINITY_DN7934_c0_g1_i2:143-2044(-)
MTVLTRRIRQLNLTGRLAEHLILEEVIGPLSDIDEDTALQILDDLENQGSKVGRPTAYVIAAANRRRPADRRQSKLRRDDDTRQSKSRPISDAGSSSGGGIGKMIGHLNRSGCLQERIVFDSVSAALTSIGDDAAMRILEDLERAADQVRNPSKYILVAAHRAGAEIDTWDDNRTVVQGENVDPTGELGKQIGWLNRSAKLQENISYNDVVGTLSLLDVTSAIDILRDVESSASSIRKPGAYILAAAKNALHQRRGSKEQPGSEEEEDRTKIVRTVGWINRHIPLVEKISLSDVVGPLSAIDSVTAMKILKSLEGKHDTIKNPTGYVLKAAANAEGRQADDAGSIASALEKDRMRVDPSGKIRRSVSWLNNHAHLEQCIAFADVVGPLSDLEIHNAMKILNDVRDRAETIRNPTGYILRAASKAAEWALAPRTHASTKVAALGRGVDLDPSGKIGKTVRWINENKELRQPLSFDAVIEPLSALDIKTALKILTDLEDRAQEVQNPNGYVVRAAKNALDPKNRDSSQTRDPASKRSRPAAHDAHSAVEFKEISRKVGQLNKIADWPLKLSYSDIKEPLEQCGVELALDILEDLEYAHNVQDPTDYVLSAARKFTSGEGGRQAKRARHCVEDPYL